MEYKKNCLQCNKTFSKGQNVSRASWFGNKRRPNGVQFCSRECAVVFQHFTPVSVETKKKLSNSGKKAYQEGRQTGFEKGNIPWNKGKQGPRPPNWKGEEAGYFAKHDWVYRHYGKPKQCEHCGVMADQKRLHWANKNHQYKRDMSEWMQLCCSCHAIHDIALRGGTAAVA